MSVSVPDSEAVERQRARRPIPKMPPAYLSKTGSPLAVDRKLYAAIQSAPRASILTLTLPIRSGRAWEVPAGSIVRISTPEGPQVGRLSLPRTSITVYEKHHKSGRLTMQQAI